MKRMHTQVEAPLRLRKTLLHSALGTAEAIKTLDSIRTYEEEKSDLRTKLKTSLQGVETALETLKKGIPPLPKEFLEKQAQIKKQQMVKKTVKHIASMPHEVAEQLDMEIMEIKKRLQHLQL